MMAEPAKQDSMLALDSSLESPQCYKLKTVGQAALQEKSLT